MKQDTLQACINYTLLHLNLAIKNILYQQKVHRPEAGRLLVTDFICSAQPRLSFLDWSSTATSWAVALQLWVKLPAILYCWLVHARNWGNPSQFHSTYHKWHIDTLGPEARSAGNQDNFNVQ